MSLKNVSKAYQVPAKRGGRIVVDGKPGVITTSAAGAYLRVKLDGSKHSVLCHPTWSMVYLDKDGKQIWPTA